MQVDEKALEAAYEAGRDYVMDMDDRTKQMVRVCVRAYLSALGEQKPVAWRWKQKGRTDADAWNYSFGHPQLSADLYVTESLYASPLPVRPITDEDVERAAKAVSDEWGKMVAEMSPHMSPGDVARSFVSPGNHRLIRAALDAAGGRG